MSSQITGILLSSLMISSPYFATKDKIHTPPVTISSEALQNITPAEELKRLKEGNARFVHNQSIQRNPIQQAKLTGMKDQFPAALILSCMDSRGSPELIFDQGLGDVFAIRVAGNVIDTDQVGSMEHATKIVGSKVILVMGHTQCSAMQDACQNVHIGNLTKLLNKIQPSVNKVKIALHGRMDCKNDKTMDKIAKQNVLDMMQQIKNKSVAISEQLDKQQVMLIGAMHDLRSGNVIFFDEKGNEV